jgi:predicted Zn-dependent protease with MMP-like domain
MGFFGKHIIIYVEAIYQAEGGNIEGVCQSVRHVYLHELGHALGLGELELKERSL